MSTRISNFLFWALVAGAFIAVAFGHFAKEARGQDDLIVETSCDDLLVEYDTGELRIQAVDGQHYIFSFTEDKPIVSPPETPVVFVNVNTASLIELQALSGIAESKAQTIIDFRLAFGPFSAIEDLAAVPGIGPATLKAIAPFVVFE